MIIGKKCSLCKGKGFSMNAGHMRKNCRLCGGTGIDDSPGEHNMRKMLKLKTVGIDLKETKEQKAQKSAAEKVEKMVDQPEKEVKKSIAEMTTEELKAAMPKKRGKSKKE